ncbi:DUF3644 domain-containing protein [Ligilactobacillus saerimneri]|uniref:DUF3644 domain-containing protein n=1 Tax=Ligilactobacillus saerimneri 30a TaxID=1227363 RepID=M5J4Q9_9LACO|nr:DUF3644 domain-containing protein [Ligilactobacillus saerimneri]EKW99413.1 hypothetical protein D271_02499 [Ligilactobacillus saerimneri 30a]
MENIAERLVAKSIEAFIMGLEIYNKPTIKYRVEGFSFFICNAWELMLKAYLINKDGESSVYFKDKPDRTLSLENVLKKVFTNKHDPIRLNIERIIVLRNTSTHFITEDYEMIYAPLFQAAVINFNEKLIEFHNIDITDSISSNFLTLNMKIEDLSDNNIRAKYSNILAERLIRSRDEISKDIANEGSGFAIPVETHFTLTKNKEDADITFRYAKESDNSMTILHDIKDPSAIYIYTTKKVIQLVNKRLKKDNILLSKMKKGEKIKSVFTTNDFQLFIKFYGIKENSKYSYLYTIGNRYGYSIKVIDFIVEEIKKRPDTIIETLKSELKK